MYTPFRISTLLAMVTITACASPSVPLFNAVNPGAAVPQHYVPHPAVYSDLLRLSPAQNNIFMPNPITQHQAPVAVNAMTLTPGLARAHAALANEQVEAMLFGRSSSDVKCYFRGPEEGCWITEEVGCHKKRCWRYCNRCNPVESKCGSKAWCYFSKTGTDYMACETAEDCKVHGRNTCNCYWGCKANGWSC